MADPRTPPIVHELEKALKCAAQFIEYARYELQPGKATIGDQFPRQDDADRVLAEIAAALAERPAPLQQKEIAAIRQRLAKRREPKIGVCTVCGHRRKMPVWWQATSSMADAAWRWCRQCGAQITITVMTGGEGPSPDEDIRTLLELVGAGGAPPQTEPE